MTELATIHFDDELVHAGLLVGSAARQTLRGGLCLRFVVPSSSARKASGRKFAMIESS